MCFEFDYHRPYNPAVIAGLLAATADNKGIDEPAMEAIYAPHKHHDLVNHEPTWCQSYA